jgi:hypothetical protein
MMKKRMLPAAAIVLAGILLLVSPTPAMESDHYAINWDLIGSGGGPISSTSYALNATIGQASIGFKSSSNYDLCSGFWCGAEVAYDVYLPMVLRNF